MTSCIQRLRSIFTQEKFPWTENFPKISLLKVEIFQLQNFFFDGKFVSPIKLYKIFFPRKWAFTFQAGTTATLNWVLERFSIINLVLILIPKLYYFHTMDNRRQVFFCNHLVQRVCLSSTLRSHPACLRFPIDQG
jgi:hypothetical protein